MVKTIKVIRLARGESVLITSATVPAPPCPAAVNCPYACGKQEHPCDVSMKRQQDKAISYIRVA